MLRKQLLFILDVLSIASKTSAILSLCSLRMLIDQEKCFSSWKHVGKLGNIVSATKMFLNLSGNIFSSQEANFISTTMFPGVGKQGNMDRKLNVSTTMFPSLPRA